MKDTSPQRRGHHNITWLVRVAAACVIPTYRLFAKSVYEGIEYLPRHGAFIVTPNHTSEIDSMTIAIPLYYCGINPMFLAKASLFKIPVLGSIMRATDQVPVHRGTAISHQALIDAQKHVAAGKPVIIYPEGTFTTDPDLWPMRGYPGAARLALAMGIPVIPVAHWGDERIVGRGLDARSQRSIWPWPRHVVRVCFGPPVDLSPWQQPHDNREQLPLEQRLQAVAHADAVAATSVIMDQITELLAKLRDERPPAGRWDIRRSVRQ